MHCIVVIELSLSDMYIICFSSLIVGYVAMLVITAMLAVCALVMYARYRDCDPRIDGRVEKPDQVCRRHIVIMLVRTYPMNVAIEFFTGISCASKSLA